MSLRKARAAVHSTKSAFSADYHNAKKKRKYRAQGFNLFLTLKRVQDGHFHEL
ncbi:hypothetical protein BRAS3843_3160057 [Bradyrhizobium sp. STM 3843]|nr:hypothetical protein BRAS3843_3160057 [Bradyrhizobium sp. STM 3843]